MNESACSTPAKRSRTDGAASAAPPYAPSTCIHRPCSLADRGDAGQVVDGADVGRPGRGRHREEPVRRPRPRSPPPAPRRSSGRGRRARSGAGRRPSPTPRSPRDECVSSVHATRSRPPPSPRAARWACRAATSADRLPIVPPETKQPAVVAGRPASRRASRAPGSRRRRRRRPPSRSRRRSTTPPTTRSNSIESSVGAAGMNARKRGLSIEMMAGASTSAKSRSAASPPRPSSVIGRAGRLRQLLRRPRTVERHRVRGAGGRGRSRARPGPPARSRRCTRCIEVGSTTWRAITCPSGRRAPGPSVTSSAYSRSPPTGRPLASRVTRLRSRSRSAR